MKLKRLREYLEKNKEYRGKFILPDDLKLHQLLAVFMQIYIDKCTPDDQEIKLDEFYSFCHLRGKSYLLHEQYRINVSDSINDLLNEWRSNSPPRERIYYPQLFRVRQHGQQSHPISNQTKNLLGN